MALRGKYSSSFGVVPAQFKRAVIAALACVALLGVITVGSPAPSLAEGPVGLMTQPWFQETFLDLKEDLNDAQSEGKGLIVAFEQAGCPYCRELHEVNFKDAELVSYLRENFHILPLDLRGSREVTDFDGEAMEERGLSRRWRVVFTPTILIFAKDAEIDATKPGREQVTAMMPGYFKPFHFRTMLEYVAGSHHKDKHFQDFVNERAKRLRDEGKDVQIW